MQALSFRTLGAAYCDDDVIEAFISGIGTMDDTLLEDGTYFAATAQGRIVGCGGWSWRTPAYTSHMTAAPTAASVTKATVRSLYVHPDFARRGVARAIMTAIEAEIMAAGYGTSSLTATLSGIPLYRRLGYRSGQPVALRLPDELTFVGLGMTKHFSQQTVGFRSAA
jgi:GNAT superfamily N-acetyltransferase